MMINVHDEDDGDDDDDDDGGGGNGHHRADGDRRVNGIHNKPAMPIVYIYIYR